MISRKNFPAKWLQQISAHLALEEPLWDNYLTNHSALPKWQQLLQTRLSDDRNIDIYLNDSKSMFGWMIYLKLRLEGIDLSCTYNHTLPKVLEAFVTSFNSFDEFETFFKKHKSEVSRFLLHMTEFCGRQLIIDVSSTPIIWHPRTTSILDSIVAAARRQGLDAAIPFLGCSNRLTNLLEWRYQKVFDAVLEKIITEGFSYFYGTPETGNLLSAIEAEMAELLAQDVGSETIAKEALKVLNKEEKEDVLTHYARELWNYSAQTMKALQGMGLWLTSVKTEGRTEDTQTSASTPTIPKKV